LFTLLNVPGIAILLSMLKAALVALLMQGTPYLMTRSAILSDGWTPAASKEDCKVSDLCDLFPEAEVCAGTGVAPCVMIWKRDGKTLTVYTVGEDVGVSSYKVE
jgi:hypothetical protein